MQIADPKWKYREFFDEVDAMVPPWREPVTIGETSKEGAMIYPENAASQRTMHTLMYAPYEVPESGIRAGDALTGLNSGPWTTEFTMPFVAYIRAMDPAGYIAPLQIKTCQNPLDDTTGYDQRIVAQKRRQGWLICERADTARALGVTFDTEGKSDREYGEYLRTEWLRRRRARARHDEQEQEKMQTSAERSLVEQQKKQTEILSQQGAATREMVAEMVSTLIPEITKAVIAGVQAKAAAK